MKEEILKLEAHYADKCGLCGETLGRVYKVSDVHEYKRQGLMITLNQLHNLIDKLSEEFDDGSGAYATDDDRVFQVDIVNETPGCSDTWEIDSIMTNAEPTQEKNEAKMIIKSFKTNSGKQINFKAKHNPNIKIASSHGKVTK